MSTLTANYGLTKPAGTENYSVPIVNANNDIIDTQLKNRQNEAAAASAAAAAANTNANGVQTNLNKIKSGTFNIPAVNNGANSGAIDVTFPSPYTGSPPVVVVTPGSGRLGVAITAITLTKFTVQFDNWSGGNAVANTGRYIAMPETP